MKRKIGHSTVRGKQYLSKFNSREASKEASKRGNNVIVIFAISSFSPESSFICLESGAWKNKTDQRLFACYVRQPFFGSYSPPKRTCPRSAFDRVTTDHKRLMTVLLPRSYRQLILHFYFRPFNYTV